MLLLGYGEINREKIINILKSTASYDSLQLSEDEQKLYRTLLNDGQVSSITDKQFFFGSGLINADAAVRAVKK
jgi:serine protease